MKVKKTKANSRDKRGELPHSVGGGSKNIIKTLVCNHDILYIIGKLITCALRICNCFWAWGSFQPLEHVLENGPEKWFFLLFSNYMFLESWDQAWNESVGIFRIRGYLRSWEVIKGQTWKITEPRHVICFWKPLEVSM